MKTSQKTGWKHLVSTFLIMLIVAETSPLALALDFSVLEDSLRNESVLTEEVILPQNYSSLMRDWSGLSEPENAENLKADFENFIESEELKLKELGVGWWQRNKYIKRLKGQLNDFGNNNDEIILKKNEIELENPSKFNFYDKTPRVESFEIRQTLPTKISDDNEDGGFFSLIPMTNAAPAEYLPVIEEIQESSDLEITQAIKKLANELNNNPVEILNFVRSNISYEPYRGSKKGSTGCLIERVCNDVDTSSLTIALMRAAGIPARYKSGFAAIEVEALKELLGVDETKTAYFALGAAEITIGTVSGTDLGKTLMQPIYLLKHILAWNG